jgi:hypothetical protein
MHYLYSHCGREFGSFPVSETTLPYNFTNSTPIFVLKKELKAGVHTNTYTQIFIAALFMRAKR